MKQTNQKNSFQTSRWFEYEPGNIRKLLFCYFLLRVVNTYVYGYIHIYLKFLLEAHAEKWTSEMI